MCSLNMISPNYFAALRIPLLQGRIWSEDENQNGALVAVINRTMAQRYFPNGDALGHSVKLPAIEDRPPAELAAPNFVESWLPILGIVEDARNDGLGDPIRPAIYIPYTLHMSMGTQILVRAETSPLRLVHSIRTQLTAVNADQQAYNNITELDTWITDETEWQQGRLVSWIFGAFAALALALAAVGLFSVVSYTVAQRTNEFGIRMALGAQRAHVLRIVFASTFVSVGSGILIGFACTFALNRIIAKWAEGNPNNPIILLEGTVILVLVSAIACALPALRAAHLNPMAALRCE
jgi:hypothetical protein